MITTNNWKTIKIPPALHAIMKSEAARNGLPLTDLVETILIEWLRRQGLSGPEPQYAKPNGPDLLLVGHSDPLVNPSPDEK